MIQTPADPFARGEAPKLSRAAFSVSGLLRFARNDVDQLARFGMRGGAMPAAMKWGLIGAAGALCLGAAYLFVTRGSAILLDIGGALTGCF
jgi:hypothetical protein